MPEKDRPNIFRLATTELTQDSFLAWLLQWADGAYKHLNPNLNKTAQDFLRLLIGQENTYEITKVDAGRQRDNIDVWAEVNEEYFLCIEDKTNTGEHSDQLQRYVELISQKFSGKDRILKFVYLKTGNESAVTLQLIRDKSYLVVDRLQVLQILNRYDVENEIFNDFRRYLAEIEEKTASCDLLTSVNNELSTAEGFYMKLQELIPEWTDWKYVSNPNGGFLGFWYHWVTAKNFQLYIQIENIIQKKIQVNIKIASWDPSITTLKQVCAELQSGGKKYSLNISNPRRYRLGKTSTLATVHDIISETEDGFIDMNKTLNRLQNLQSVLDDYVIEISTELK